jgi:hypothetical protein
MRAAEFVEDVLNKNDHVRQPRMGARHKRGHAPVQRYKKIEYCNVCDHPADQCICDEEKLDELSFMGMSQCTKDCSGHEAGYAWSKQRGGANAASWSPSFNKGAAIAAAGY